MSMKLRAALSFFFARICWPPKVVDARVYFFTDQKGHVAYMILHQTAGIPMV